MLEFEKEKIREWVQDLSHTDLADMLVKLLPYKDYRHSLYPTEGNWEIGDIVQYRRSIDWGPSQGSYAVIDNIAEDWDTKHYSEYSWFWCTPIDIKTGNRGSGYYHTTPDDVILVRKHNAV